MRVRTSLELRSSKRSSRTLEYAHSKRMTNGRPNGLIRGDRGAPENTRRLICDCPASDVTLCDGPGGGRDAKRDGRDWTRGSTLTGVRVRGPPQSRCLGWSGGSPSSVCGRARLCAGDTAHATRGRGSRGMRVPGTAPARTPVRGTAATPRRPHGRPHGRDGACARGGTEPRCREHGRPIRARNNAKILHHPIAASVARVHARRGYTWNTVRAKHT